MAATTQTLARDGSLRKMFNYKPMRMIMGYLSTYNMETQAVAIDANAEDIQTTGTGAAIINGTPVVLAEDPALVILSDTEGTLAAWATATSYSVDDLRKNKDEKRFRCILAHTSSAATQPMYGESWETYWEVQHHEAVNAAGDVITGAGYSKYYMITAKLDGTITLWICGDEGLDGAEVMKVPVYDYKEYVVIGFLHVNAAAAHTMGTTALTTVGTFFDAIGPVFPHPDNLASIL
jgi:hypothetical protein